MTTEPGLTMSVKLSPSEVRDAVIALLRDKYNLDVIGDVTLNVDSEWTGYGPGECRVPSFTGASANVRASSQKK